MAIFYALLCVLAWSCIPVVAKLTQGDAELDSFQLLFWSNVLSTVVVAPFALRLRAARRPSTNPPNITFKSIAFTALLGFFGCFFYYLCLYYGYANANSIDVLITQYTWPASMAILGMIILRESITARKIVGIGLGFLAAIIVISKGNVAELTLDNPSVLLIVLLGATGFALFSVLSKKDSTFSANGTVFLYFAFATVFSLIALLWHSTLTLPPQSTWLSLLLNGALFNGLSYILWIRALNLTDASNIAPLVYLAPVLSVIWLVIVFAEPFYFAYAVGIALTVLSGLIISTK